MLLPSGRSGGLGIRCPQQISGAHRAFSREAEVAAPRKYSQRGREDSAEVTRVDADEGEKGHLVSQGLFRQVPTALEGQNRALGLGGKEASPPA